MFRRHPGQIRRSQTGASNAEYATLLALIGALVIVVLFVLGNKVTDIFGEANTAISLEGNGSGNGGSETPGPDDPFAFNVTVDGANKSFAAIGPGETSTVAWNIVNGYWIEYSMVLNGSCEAAETFENIYGGSGESEGPSSISGSQAIAWSADKVGCSYEACFYASSTENDFSQCAEIGFAETPQAGNTNPVVTAVVNGNIAVTIPQAGTANFSWTNTYPFNAVTNMTKDGSACAADGDVTALAANGFETIPWSTEVQNCTVTICTSGTKTTSWSTYRQRCATAYFARPAASTADTTPDGMVFTPLFGQTANTQVTSNAATVTGINAATTLSVAGGTASVNGGAYQSGSITVNAGDTVTLRTTSGPNGNSIVNVSLASGVFGSTWTVGNASADQTPNTFNFTSLTNQRPNTVVYSNTVSPSSMNAMPFSIEGGYAVPRAQLPGQASGSLGNFESIYLVTTTPMALGEAKTVTMRYGPGLSLTKTWTVTNRATQDDTPNTMAFTTNLNASSASQLVSNTQIATGFDYAMDFTFDGQICVNGSCGSGSMSVSPGDTIQLMTDMPLECNGETWGFGTINGTWNACPTYPEPNEEDQANWCAPKVFPFTEMSHTVGWAPNGTWEFAQIESYDAPPGYKGYASRAYGFHCSGGSWDIDYSSGLCGTNVGEKDPNHQYEPYVAACRAWIASKVPAGYTCAVTSPSSLSSCISGMTGNTFPGP